MSPDIFTLLYKGRWNVERVFDEFKDKLGETKSRASTANAKTCQARLLCLTHNLMTLTEEPIFREAEIQNEAEVKRKLRTLVDWDKDSKIHGGSGLTVLQKAIRWFKNDFDPSASGPKPTSALPKSTQPHEPNVGHR